MPGRAPTRLGFSTGFQESVAPVPSSKQAILAAEDKRDHPLMPYLHCSVALAASNPLILEIDIYGVRLEGNSMAVRRVLVVLKAMKVGQPQIVKINIVR